jgi:hypothetical protein
MSKTQDGLASKRQPRTAREVAAENHGAIVVDETQLPNDPHLTVVLCRLHPDNVQPYVVWYFNKDYEGFGTGAYCDDIFDAAKAYKERVERYGGTINKRR